MDCLKDNVALVTGASRGIGRHVAKMLAEAGATVVLSARDTAKLNGVRDEIMAAGGQAVVMASDLADESSLIGLVDALEARYGRLDILVNNAGVTHSALLEQTDTADWDAMMTINARGPFILCRQSLKLLKQSPRAFIINIASVVGIKGYACQSAYTASKHALRGMSIALAEELRQSRVRVHVLCPGGVDTEMVSQVRPDINKEDLIAPEEIAELVLYLVTHKGNAVLDELRIRRAVSGPWY